LDFINDTRVRNWVERHAVLGGYDHPEEFVQRILHHAYIQSNGHYEAEEKVTSAWQAEIKSRREEQNAVKGVEIE
jgi:hypothetical protein